MTPQEKAKELYRRYSNFLAFSISDFKMRHEAAKQCAIIAVDEIMEENIANNVHAQIGYTVNGYLTNEQYWQQVKQEIEKI